MTKFKAGDWVIFGPTGEIATVERVAANGPPVFYAIFADGTAMDLTVFGIWFTVVE